MKDINTLMRLRRELEEVINREDGICDTQSLSTDTKLAWELTILLREATLKISLALLKAT